MIKIGVLGDRHVDHRHPAFAESLRMWDFAIEDAIAQGVHGFVGCGDVMEVGATPADIDAVAERYARMLDDGRWVHEIQGNHEAYGGLRWARHVASGLLTVVDAQVRVVPLPEATWDLSGVLVVLIPYCRRGYPPFDGGELFSTSLQLFDYYAAAGRYVGTVIADAKRTYPNLPLIVAGHWTPAGFEVGPSELEQTASKEMIVPLDALAPADLVLVGHIHKAQQIGNVVGVGSMFRTTFAECAQQKSYVIVTVDGGTVSWERRPLPTRPMRELRIPGARVAEFVASILAEDPNQDVKFVIEATPDDQTVYADLLAPLDALPGRFPWEVIRPTVQVTRAPEIEQSVTIANDFTVWLPLTYPDLAEARRAGVLDKAEAV